jgi:hypothetical protein
MGEPAKIEQKRPTLTQEVLISMLKENTGRHMLDSGGAYGRNWERNQEREFLDEPIGSLNFSVFTDREGIAHLSLDPALNVFGWLEERVEFEPHLQKMFDKFAESPEFEDEYWLPIMEAFANDLGGLGLYGDSSGPFVVNTYNGEDILSQVLQFVYFEIEDSDDDKIDDGSYILLQIHGGCDVRGGYTDPKIFSVSIEEYSILDNARAVICPEIDPDAPEQLRIPGTGTEETPYWDTDNAGYHWTSEYYEDLGDYPFIESDDPADWTRGTLRVDSEGNGYCPITGGKLTLHSF